MTTPKRSEHWTAVSNLARAIQVLKNESLAAFWFKFLSETIYRRVIVIERKLDEPIPEFDTRMPIEIGVLDETQIEDYAHLRPEAVAGEVLRRLLQGDLCHTARHDGRLVYVSWSMTGRARIEYLDRETLLAADEIYSYEAFTAPEYRGANIAAAVGAVRLKYFRDLGYHRILAVVMPENKRALRSFAKLGYRPCGTMSCLRIGPWRRESIRGFTRRTVYAVSDDPVFP